MLPMERVAIARFVVGRPIVPAAPDDANPFERERADRGVVRLPATALLGVIRRRPRTVVDRVLRELVKGLAHEGGGGPAPLHLARATALDGDRRNPAVLLDLGGRREARAIGAEGDEEPRGQGRRLPG